MEVHSYCYFQLCGYFWCPWVSFVMTDNFSVRVTKNYCKDWCLMNSQPTFLFLTNLNLIMTILLKACKPDNVESRNSLKLSFTIIWGLHSNFIDCESFLESNSLGILALCEANLDDSINSGNFSVRDDLPLKSNSHLSRKIAMFASLEAL